MKRPAKRRTSVLLADDHGIMREGLRALLERLPDVTVVGEAESGTTAVEMATRFAPDVVIMDIGMPDLNGIEATRQILERNPATKVIALSMHSDGRYVSGMIRAGAAGYLVKDSASRTELARAIVVVRSGEVYLCPRCSRQVVSDYLSSRATSEQPQLTELQRQIVQLVAAGSSSKEIATRLGLTIKAIDGQRARIMELLGLQGVAGLTKYAIRTGLSSLQ
jgi:DNA-binding NarL/FixJ family response regulator